MLLNCAESLALAAAARPRRRHTGGRRLQAARRADQRLAAKRQSADRQQPGGDQGALLPVGQHHFRRGAAEAIGRVGGKPGLGQILDDAAAQPVDVVATDIGGPGKGLKRADDAGGDQIARRAAHPASAVSKRS